MKIICQTCGQRLPKTAVMCPNCGGRHFSPEPVNAVSHEAVNATANTAAMTPTMTNLTNLANQATAASQPPSQTAPNPAMPVASWQTPATSVSATSGSVAPSHYVPPVAPPAPPARTQPYPAPASMPVTAPAVQPAPVYPAPSALPAAGYGSRRAANTMHYAGFFKRGFAYGFDLILVGLLLGLGYQLALPEVLARMNMTTLKLETLGILGASIYLLYMAFLTSSGRQATIGKIIMGLWVFGMQGQRIGFFHAIVREVFKLVLLPLFFVMWFTARKQTMHDLLGRTVVLYDPY